MEVSAAIVDAVPVSNLRISRLHFAAGWGAAERAAKAPGEVYAAGVALACRWIAGAPASIRSPVFGRELRAEPETIAQEITAAVRELALASSDERRRYLQGVVATFDWAWNGSRRPPVDLPGS